MLKWGVKNSPFWSENLLKYIGGENIKNNYPRKAEDQLIKEFYKLSTVYEQLEKTIRKFEDRMWEIYEKSEERFLKKCEEIAKKFGDERLTYEESLNQMKNRPVIKEKIQED